MAAERTLTVEDIEVPEGMIEAVRRTWNGKDWKHENILATALLWLAQNPIVPNYTDDIEIDRAWGASSANGVRPSKFGAIEWQRRMFLKREPQVPEAVKELLWDSNPFPNTGSKYRHDEAVRRAYKIGKGERNASVQGE
jgi:hypothetical protein